MLCVCWAEVSGGMERGCVGIGTLRGMGDLKVFFWFPLLKGSEFTCGHIVAWRNLKTQTSKMEQCIELPRIELCIELCMYISSLYTCVYEYIYIVYTCAYFL